MENKVINELNSFLEGNFMAIQAYENYIQHIDDPEIKQTLQRIQQDHKHHAAKIAERIQNLGGVPVDGVSMKGKIAKFMNTLKGETDDSISILKDALVGEDRGIEMSKKLVQGDLDSESLALVKEILSRDERHVELLNQRIDSMK